jgi:hypothetical protein
MNKYGIAVLGTLIGVAVGILVGYGLFANSTPKPFPSQPQHYYYRLNDSTVVRHTISVTDSGLHHKVDTVAVEVR